MNNVEGVWVACYSDLSEVLVFKEEIDALREGVRSSMCVVFVPFGKSIRKVLAKADS